MKVHVGDTRIYHRDDIDDLPEDLNPTYDWFVNTLVDEGGKLTEERFWFDSRDTAEVFLRHASDNFEGLEVGYE